MPPVTAARSWAAVSAVLAFFLILVMVVSLNGSASGVDGAERPDSSQPQVVAVTLTEFAITPSDITVRAGEPVVFEIANEGSAEHDFHVGSVAVSDMIPAGGRGTLEVDALEPGEHELLCEVPGHAGAGMVGTLTAAEGQDEAGTGDQGTGDQGENAHGAHGASEMTAAEMAAKHDDLSAFPAETQGVGNQPMEPVMDGGVKVFELTATEVEWEVEPGVFRPGLAYNGQVPGPRIDVDLGDEVRIVLHNELDVPTALHLHGLVLDNEMDGVPGLTQNSLLPGESFTYEVEVANAGSHMYHSHFNSAEQVPGGLLGAFIVHGPDEPEVDHDYVMILNDGPLGYTLNGKGFPATEPLVVKQGETARVRYMNEGLQVHPMHLHGMPQRVIANDGYMLDQPYTEDNLLVSPGDRFDVIVEATEPGAWAWHCHILTHAEGPDGMFGMVTAMIVEQ